MVTEEQRAMMRRLVNFLAGHTFDGTESKEEIEAIVAYFFYVMENGEK